MRLIDADALKEKAYSVTVKFNEWHRRTNINIVDMEDIDNTPTIDAVQVVRCKECKHFRTFRTSSDGEEIRACVGKGIVDLNYDDFCSKAERKDNED